jgi:hypothetical protein
MQEVFLPDSDSSYDKIRNIELPVKNFVITLNNILVHHQMIHMETDGNNIQQTMLP